MPTATSTVRLPKGIYQRAKVYCARTGQPIKGFVAAAIARALPNGTKAKRKAA